MRKSFSVTPLVEEKARGERLSFTVGEGGDPRSRQWKYALLSAKEGFFVYVPISETSKNKTNNDALRMKESGELYIRGELASYLWLRLFKKNLNASNFLRIHFLCSPH